jgi:AcrR family transcriptional regulator
MPEWVPVSTSSRGRLAEAALRAFGSHSFDEVGVVDLARSADTTTGSLYHHFGSKLGLYAFVREDVERRLLDRMQGAAAVVNGSGARVSAALLVAFDYAVASGYARMLAAPLSGRPEDPVQSFIATMLREDDAPYSEVLVAAWRAALEFVIRGGDGAAARKALESLRVEIDPGGLTSSRST